jgi:mannitol-1-phosphate 5-dehydrogenase
VIFADVNETLIGAIQQDKSYTVFIKDSECESIPVGNISAYHSNSEQLTKEFLNAEVVTTSVGFSVLPYLAPAIVKGLRLRIAEKIAKPLNFFACENGIKGTEFLEEAVLKLLEPQEIEYVKEYCGFANCTVDRIVPPVRSENPLDVVVERFCEWKADSTAVKGDLPKIQGLIFTDKLQAYVERKLLTLNAGHAITAYLGAIKGHKTILDSIQDVKIFPIVKGAMQESGAALIRKHHFNSEDHAAYIEQILKRFQNPYLQDECIRVGREPYRKLSGGDRLILPLKMTEAYGLPNAHLLIGVSAAFHYYDAQEKQSVEMQASIKKEGLRFTICKITGLEGNDLLVEKIVLAYNEVIESLF